MINQQTSIDIILHGFKWEEESMVQAISNDDTQNVSNVAKSNKKTNIFSDIFEKIQNYNEEI